MTTVTTPAVQKNATTIIEVLAQLDSIIQWSIHKKSRIGYFTILYKQMTEAIKKGIETGAFNNPKRMELLDVIFANRYINAWNAYQSKQLCTNAWCTAFDAANNNNLIVLQHIILGINTHINLDLGIAAAEAAPGDSIHDLKNDFEKINEIIAELSGKMQEALCRIWYPLRIINKISRNREEAVINFSIQTARKASWANAVALASAAGQGRSNYINLIDSGVVLIGKKIINPGLFTSFLLKPVRVMEDKDVGKILQLLQSH